MKQYHPITGLPFLFCLFNLKIDLVVVRNEKWFPEYLRCPDDLRGFHRANKYSAYKYPRGSAAAFRHQLGATFCQKKRFLLIFMKSLQ